VREWKHWSPHHIQSAATAAHLCLELESAGNPQPTDLVRQRAFVTTSIFHCVAFLEALANELMASCVLEAPFAQLISKLSEDQTRRLAVLWNSGADRMSTTSKFQVILGVLDREVFDKGRNPYQDANLVIRLRNELVHYKPELTERELGSPSELRHWLAGKFSLNPFTPASMADHLDSYLSAGCAAWAAKSSLGFADDFYARLGVVPLYAEASPLARELL